MQPSGTHDTPSLVECGAACDGVLLPDASNQVTQRAVPDFTPPFLFPYLTGIGFEPGAKGFAGPVKLAREKNVAHTSYDTIRLKFGLRMLKMTFPLIGITAYMRHIPPQTTFDGVRDSYVRAISAAGALALLIPPQPEPERIAALLDQLDGVLLTGGDDLDPAGYGEAPHPRTQAPDPVRDAAELALARAALARKMPILGICRGMQVINVALGGSLYQDLADQYPADRPHPKGLYQELAHAITVDPQSQLCVVLGTTELRVNSLHHQGIKTPGQGVRIVARAPDGVPEGIEVEGHPHVLAVQYHPEEFALSDQRALNLFAQLVAAAQEFHAMRSITLTR